MEDRTMAGIFGGLFDFNHDGKMDADERREVLEEAGLDPDDYDF